jgi:dTMP kinase
VKKGLFITVEGMDGSGKTTQIKLMEKYLVEKGMTVVLTREPGGTNISEWIRSIILDARNTEMGHITEMLLYASARAQLVAQVIKPALQKGSIVICDRFIDSSYVYQGFGRGIGIKTVENVNRIALDGIEPDITYFFDLKPEIALKRRMAATESDRIENEKMEFHNKVYEGYLKLAEIFPERIRAINSTGTIDDIFNKVKVQLDDLLSRKAI